MTLDGLEPKETKAGVFVGLTHAVDLVRPNRFLKNKSASSSLQRATFYRAAWNADAVLR